MQRQLPVLIFAQSARFIAESATLAGYTVWVADCFCDTDTVAVAQRSFKISNLATLSEAEFFSTIEALSQGESCHMLMGTGIEQFYPLIHRLPHNIEYLGNSTQTLSQLRQPSPFFDLLDSLKLPYPQVKFSPPQSNPASWLYKDLAGYGGQSIQAAVASIERENGYYQAWAQGRSASVCFLANGEQAIMLNINEQINLDNRFQLAQIQTPIQLSHTLEQSLQHSINSITKATVLKGLCSLDVIIDGDEFSILEVNPRFSASAELNSYQAQLFQWHLNAVAGKLPTLPIQKIDTVRFLAFYYAEKDSVICAQPIWPDSCHDLPAAGSQIIKGAPVCTIIVKADNHADCEAALTEQRFLIQQNFVADS